MKYFRFSDTFATQISEFHLHVCHILLNFIVPTLKTESCHDANFWPPVGLLPDAQNCELCMRRECRESLSRHRLQRKSLVSDPGMHHGTCVGGENVPGIRGACTTRNFTYLVRGPLVARDCPNYNLTGSSVTTNLTWWRLLFSWIYTLHIA